jgi:ribosomal protein S25
MDIKEQIQNLARDLLNLEIITIIKPNITGRKMPAPQIALAEICSKYSIKLMDFDAEIKLAPGEVWGGRETFVQIMKTTDSLIKKLKEEIKAAQRVDKDLPPKRKAGYWMLYRIKTMSQALKGIFVQQADGTWKIEAATDHLVLIRKAWELGIEEVALKTVIQLDGDVITRVQESYATEKHATVHKLHNMGVTTSLAFWKTLVEIVESFVTGLVKLVVPNK